MCIQKQFKCLLSLSGALKRNLTAEQVKADLLSLGTMFLHTHHLYLFDYIYHKSIFNSVIYCLNTGLNEDKARHFSDQVCLNSYFGVLVVSMCLWMGMTVRFSMSASSIYFSGESTTLFCPDWLWDRH